MANKILQKYDQCPQHFLNRIKIFKSSVSELCLKAMNPKITSDLYRIEIKYLSVNAAKTKPYAEKSPTKAAFWTKHLRLNFSNDPKPTPTSF